MKDARSPASALAALEALFDPSKKKDTHPPSGRTRIAKMVPPRVVAFEPRAEERARLVAQLVGAEGQREVTRAADAIADAGLSVGDDQDALLALLQHGREEEVRAAITTLERVLAAEPPRRRAVLDARLRRLEDDADEAPTRAAAAALRRRMLAPAWRAPT